MFLLVFLGTDYLLTSILKEEKSKYLSITVANSSHRARVLFTALFTANPLFVS